jgi:hypothetical protein
MPFGTAPFCLSGLFRQESKIQIPLCPPLIKGEEGGFSFVFSSLYPDPGTLAPYLSSDSFAFATRAWFVLGYFLITWL